MIKIILVNSQQNFFDIQNRFAGWYDVGLTQQGIDDAKQIANVLKQNNIKIDYCFMSVLLRAEQTFSTIAKELGYKIRNFKSYKLNERQLGALQGLNRQIAKELYGEDIVDKLNIDSRFTPPKLAQDDPQNPNADQLYSGLKESMPLAESSDDVFKRCTEYLKNFVFKTVKPNQTALVVCHAEVLRCLENYFLPQTNAKTQLCSSKNSVVVLELTDDAMLCKSYCL